jgi:hypothetical protein
MTLSIRELPDDVDTLTAALEYAAAGWYVLPVARIDRVSPGKNPGSVVGRRWHDKSSRDPKQLAAWFAATDHGIALHCGRSGAVAVDVDDPDNVPEVLAKYLHTAPNQSTRPDRPGRGHTLFLQPPGRTIGNGTGRVGGAWGEIRGLNGVIIAAPSWHPDGGEYNWIRTGAVPVLPDELADLLDDANPANDAATDAAVAAFIAEHRGNAHPQLLLGPVRKLEADIAEGRSRHDSATSAAVWATDEARAGCYNAEDAVAAVREIFIDAKTSSAGGRTAYSRAAAVDEWDGILAWAVGQTNGKTDDVISARRARIDAKTISLEDYAMNKAKTAATQAESETPPSGGGIGTESARPELRIVGDEPSPQPAYTFVNGASFILDIPDKIPALWGVDNQVLWAEGESLMIAGPMGLGKTTMAGLLIRAQLRRLRRQRLRQQQVARHAGGRTPRQDPVPGDGPARADRARVRPTVHRGRTPGARRATTDLERAAARRHCEKP